MRVLLKSILSCTLIQLLMKARFFILTFLFTAFSALSISACVWVLNHGSILGTEARGYLVTAIFLTVFFMIPTVVLWVRVFKGR